MGSRALKHRPGTKNKRRYLPALFILVMLVALIGVAYISVYSLGESWLRDLPDYEDSSQYNLARKPRVYAADGTTLLAEFYLEDREPVDSLDQVSEYVKMGTVDTEDERFYEHNGIDIQGIARAVVNNLTGGSLEGASTITQQFVRNTVLAPEAGDQTIKRKVREMYIALQLEEVYSKDEILLMYLNTVNYGSGAYGIEAASERYFQKPATELTLTEAATLVGIPQSPTYNNPIDYPEACLERRNLVLNRMLTNGDITQEEYEAAVAEPLTINPEESDSSDDGIKAYPYFTSYVRQVLLENYTEDEIFKGGLTVLTTLDVNAQNAAEAAAWEKLETVDPDLEVALVAVDPSTGYIKALVGGKDYRTDEFNLATQATRQPGSSFKTFTLLASIEDGINPNTTRVNCSSNVTIGNWTVENYGGAGYGVQTIASAFAMSSNTGFARLIDTIGTEKVVDMAQRCGIDTPLENVPSITLGSQGVTVREMAEAYATVATGGIHREAVCIQSITDYKGNVIFEADTEGERAISEEVAKAGEQVMEGVVTGGTGTQAALYSGQEVAGKTGTSEEWRDSWFCGITPQWSVAIWLGCRQERTMAESYTATSVFRSFVGTMLDGQPLQEFPMEYAMDPTYRTLTSAEMNTLGSYSSGTTDTYNYNYYTPTPSTNTTTTDGTTATTGTDGTGTYDDGTGVYGDGTGTYDDGTGVYGDGTGTYGDGTTTYDDGTGTGAGTYEDPSLYGGATDAYGTATTG